MKTKRIAILLMVFILSGGFTSFAAGFIQNGDSWQFEKADGTLVREGIKSVDGSAYYFDSDGNMVKDCLIQYGNDKYYFDADGKKLINGWRKLAEENGEEYWFYFGKDGKAKEEGWVKWNGDRYHFTDFHMDYGWYTDDEGNQYYLNSEDDGHMETGWLPYTENPEMQATEDDDENHPTGWYYFLPQNGRMLIDEEKKIATKHYAFSKDGTMIDGFGIVENKNPISLADLYVIKYYDKTSGVRADGWRYVEDADGADDSVQREDGWYYFKKGEAYTAYNNTKIINPTDPTGIKKIDKDYYAFDANGKMLKGLIQAETEDKYNDCYYYFNEDGKMQTGYVKIEDLEDSVDMPDEYMYFDPNGSTVPAHGASVTGEGKGYLYENGVRIKAESDKYELYTLSTGKTYVISDTGKIIKKGTVKLENGDRMKIYREADGGYNWKKEE